MVSRYDALLRFNPEAKKVTFYSRYCLEGHGIIKITANAEGGPALSAQAVSELLNGWQLIAMSD